MTLRDLLKQNQKAGFSAVDKGYVPACKALLELPEKKREGILFVAKILSTDFEKDDENKYIITEYFDVILYNTKTYEKIGIELMAWEDVIDLDVCQLSIDEYGEEIVLSAILNDVFFFGGNPPEHKQTVNDVIDALTEVIELYKPENGTPWNDVKDGFEDVFKDTDGFNEEEAKLLERLDNINENCLDVFIEYCGGATNG